MVRVRRGAAATHPLDYDTLRANTSIKDLPSSCVSVRCQGYEWSLAECEIYDKRKAEGRKVAAATCYTAKPHGQNLHHLHRLYVCS